MGHTPFEAHARIFHPTYVRLLCLYLSRHGVRLEEALADTGITWPQLLHEERLIPFEAMRSLVLAGKRLTGHPALGLEWGFSVEAAAHGLAGAAVAASRDVSEALRAAVRYYPLRGRAVELTFDRCEDRTRFVIHEPHDFGDVRTFILEAMVGIIERSMATLTERSLAGIEHWFPYAPPAWAGEYSRWLDGAVHFGAERMELGFPKRILAFPNVLADRTSAAVIVPAERQLALQQSQGEWAGRIKQRLLEQNGPYPSLQSMARELSVSARTLLRRLHNEGVTYQMILDDVRKEAAAWYLVKTHETIETIADRLGYADASNFSRSFRRWFGTPPARFRSARRSAGGLKTH